MKQSGLATFAPFLAPAARLLPQAARTRDARIDVLRGAALLMIFVDHIPRDALNVLTLHNFGFCDAAEIFVTLAGFSSMMAYGVMFEREGMARGIRRIGARCFRIYLAQAALLLLTVVIVWAWTTHYRLPALAFAPLIEEGVEGLIRALTLRSLPGYIDILPLYIVLLAVFPCIYLVMRRHVGLAVGSSVAVWAMANLDHDLTLPNAVDDKGWYFNPFTWQLLFTLGAALAVLMARRSAAGLSASLPRHRWLTRACWLYLGFALLQAGNWSDWNLPSLRPLAMEMPDKSHLSPLRILDILALLYLFLGSARVEAALRGRLARLVAICGRHSLEVFVVGCTCALFGRLLFRTYGSGLWMQLIVNGAGLGAMTLIAVLLERDRRAKDGARRAAVPVAPSRALGASRDGVFEQGSFGV